MHHPPVETGLSWLDSDAKEPWIARFAEAISGHPQLRGIVAGHLLRTTITSFEGVPLTVCPSSARAVILVRSPIDPDAPDGRALLIDGPAGHALHRREGNRLTSHFESVSVDEPWDVLARYEGGMHDVVRFISSELPA